jgi:hypothetical protein
MFLRINAREQTLLKYSNYQIKIQYTRITIKLDFHFYCDFVIGIHHIFILIFLTYPSKTISL